LSQLPKFQSDKLLVGLESSDDAAVYQINEETAIIQTLDFFTPVADDPYIFGQVAAANALSDVYAMGGEPLLALNIVGFPKDMNPDILAQILKGGADKVMEAGAVLAGGHSVEDKEPKYGLSVMGIVHPSKVRTNTHGEVGDALILTKPLGTGILNTAVKRGILSAEDEAMVHKVMTTLNRAAAKALDAVNPHGVTDITGFGIGGHAYEMAKGSKTTLVIDHQALPLMRGVYEKARANVVPGGTFKNIKYYRPLIHVETGVEEDFLKIIFDPQTSGGLLISLPSDQAATYLEELGRHYSLEARVIGEIIEEGEFPVIIR